jgi:hypothetical protein
MKGIKIFMLAMGFMFMNNSFAQYSKGSNYKTAIGGKFYPGAVTLKHFLDKKYALEVLGYFKDGNRITFLIEKNKSMGDIPGLKWYYGFGGHVSLYDNSYNQGKTFYGVDGILGIDLKIKGAPIDFALDWQPSFEIGGDFGFSGNWGGLSIRYVLQ